MKIRFDTEVKANSEYRVTSSFDRFTALSVSFVIGQSDYFGFGSVRHSIENRPKKKTKKIIIITEQLNVQKWEQNNSYKTRLIH